MWPLFRYQHLLRWIKVLCLTVIWMLIMTIVTVNLNPFRYVWLRYAFQTPTGAPPQDVVPLLGTLQPLTKQLNCSHGSSTTPENWTQYLQRATQQAGGTAGEGLPQDEWGAAVSVGAPLHQCQVEVEVTPCMCRRAITTLLPHPCPTTSPRHLLHHIKVTLGDSTCGDLATLRGAAQQVVVYSLGGIARENYRKGLNLVIPQIKEMYPDWSLRVYIDNTSAPYSWACPLACQYPHLDFCDVTRLPGIGDVSSAHPRIWRFGVFGDRLVRRYILRDADSPVLQREVAAVDQWLARGKCFHVMRDHPSQRLVIMTGAFGGCTSWRHSKFVMARNAAFCVPLGPDGDQQILKKLLWPIVQRNATEHDSYNCRIYRAALPFPTQRVNFTFIGMTSYRFPWVRIKADQQCPPACRPENHQDWKYC